MRLFSPSVPAGRLEYIAITIVALIAQWFALVNVLEVRVNPVTNAIAYSPNRLAPALGILMVVLTLAVITALRRAKAAGTSPALAVLMFVPIAVFFAVMQFDLREVFAQLSGLVPLLPAILSGSPTKTYAPFGEDPLDPDSWINRDDETGPAVSFHGQELLLPGEDGWNEAA